MTTTKSPKELAEELRNLRFGEKDAWERVNAGEAEVAEAEQVSDELVRYLGDCLPLIIAILERCAELEDMENVLRIEAKADRLGTFLDELDQRNDDLWARVKVLQNELGDKLQRIAELEAENARLKRRSFQRR